MLCPGFLDSQAQHLSRKRPIASLGAMFENHTFVLSDQRALAYATFGVSDGSEQATVFYCHGTPGTQYEGHALHDYACREGLRFVAITRPGFGGSSPQPNRTLLSFPQDVLALADHLDIPRFALLGVSGGCSYVLACLYAIPRPRLLCAAVAAGMYPLDLGTGNMKLSNRIMFSLVNWVPGLIELGLDWLLAGRQARDLEHPEKFAEEMEKLFKGLPAEDQASLEANGGQIRHVAVESAREGFRQGAGATTEELGLIASDWGFKLTELELDPGQLTIWHGAKDANIPVAMAEKAANMIPGAELRIERDQAHLSLSALKAGEILAAMGEKLRTS